ncbi:family 1 putative polysaccharide lyase [Cercophora samala]|uniref:Family 1 putative polysaccharide lyase n=1 Tax=Cercophora samala TaxID=330535 RepID=A0AA40D1B5_9PEZI|nr:family 1 putative polysaccharide lyase [Cercophora samala]
MKLSLLATSLSAVLATASPTLHRRQQPLKNANSTDVANIGFATLNGGTTGGLGGNATIVTTLAQLTAAVSETNPLPAIVFIKGAITGATKVRVGSNKSIIGLPGSSLRGIGFIIRRQKNVIIRNLVSSHVVASLAEDAVKIDSSTNIWIDHCEFFSALVADKDYYDGLVDASHGSDFITVSHTYFHDHWKGTLVGHSDSNAAQDLGKLRITYANNYFRNVNSRAPLIRFGTAHIFNNLYESVGSAINTRMSAQVLVESNYFLDVNTAVTSKDSKEVGYARVEDNVFGRAANNAPVGSLTKQKIPYRYTLLGSGKVQGTVPGQAGARLNVTVPVPVKPEPTTTATSTSTSKTSTSVTATSVTTTTAYVTTTSVISISTATTSVTSTSATPTSLEPTTTAEPTITPEPTTSSPTEESSPTLEPPTTTEPTASTTSGPTEPTASQIPQPTETLISEASYINRGATPRSKADKARGGAAASVSRGLGKSEAVAELALFASIAQSPTNRPAAGGRVRRRRGLAAAGGAAAVVDASLAGVNLSVGLGSRGDEGREGEEEGGGELHIDKMGFAVVCELKRLFEVMDDERA